MKKKSFLIIAFLILAIILVGCSGAGIITSSINLTGNWTMTNTTTYTTSSLIADIGAVTTSKCNIVDNDGSLTIYNFKIIGQEYINWNVGYGTFNNFTLTGNISGSYLNIYGSTVSLTLSFEGIINTDGISGNGNWTETISVYGYIDSASGTTFFIKG
jgi:hypothetical protein